MAHERKCIVDGTVYEYCPHCDQKMEHWRLIYCSENCKFIDEAIRKYESKELSAEEVKAELSSKDLSKLDLFSAWIKPKVNKILDVQVDTVEPTPIVEEIAPVVEEEPVVETENNSVVTENKYRRNKKRNRFVNEDLTETE